MTTDEERSYVRQWVETGKLLEDVRWRELGALTSEAASLASDALLAAAVLVPLPQHRREWSGLVDLQRVLHARQPA